jgi:uncharacterized iron-regulated protein
MVAIFYPPAFSAASDDLFLPSDYLHAKLQRNDIVFLGTKHKTPEILGFIAELIPSLKGLGVTHQGLEIPSDQQEKIDAFMRTGDGLDDIRLHAPIDCPEYRHLFQVLRKSGRPSPVALDLPFSMYQGDVSRDEWIAGKLLTVLQGNPAVKVLVIAGNLHTFKKLEWQEQSSDKHLSIRQYTQRERPAVRMWSVGQLIDQNPSECDFSQKYSSLPGSVALDLDDRYRGWKLGLTGPIAILPAECFYLLDGVIVY